jgi:hypothetical protein
MFVRSPVGACLRQRIGEEDELNVRASASLLWTENEQRTRTKGKHTRLNVLDIDLHFC